MGEGKGSGEGSASDPKAAVAESKQNIVEEETERGNWDNQCDFFLSCLGYAVGLGNVWRFPYLCYEHGGGTFLVAYSCMLAFAGLPLFFLELSIGQYGGLGPNKLFGRMAPAFKGLGFGMLFVSFLVVIYYNMIIAWTLFYTFAGMTSVLPWTDCGNDFNTINCYKKEMAVVCAEGNNGTSTYWNNTCTTVESICENFNKTLANLDQRDAHGFAMCANATNQTQTFALKNVYLRSPPAQDYYTRVVLGLEDDTTWENFGGLRWQLVLCLASAWLIVGLCLIKGVQSSGKVVYFTALFPYLVLLILLIKGATLPGAADGISFYLTPKPANLLKIKIWSDAATQIFYSLGPSFGGLITLASYNKFSNNCHRDAILIALANCSTSVFAGFVIFSIIGFMAHELDVPVADVIQSGPGLAFIAYPEAVTRMPVSPLWSFLFFAMLITLGLDSQFTMTETLTTAFMDQWPQFRKRKGTVVMVASAFGLLLGLPMCCKGGVFMFTLIDWFSASWSLLLLALFEIILVIYVYGHARLFENIEEMDISMPASSKLYWKINWQFITPTILAFITIVTWVNFTPCSYNGYVFPPWVQAMGWLMAATSVLITIGVGIGEWYWRRHIGKDNDKATMFSPTDKFGPAVKAVKNSSDMAMTEAAYTNDAYNSPPSYGGADTYNSNN